MARRIALLTAGKGSRLGRLTEGRNKGLLSVGNKAVVSHLLDRFPDVPVVVALGHCGAHVREFLTMAHPEREFVFRAVDYEGPLSSAGYSLLQLRDLLSGPFIVATNDTIVAENVRFAGCNWLGVAEGRDANKYTRAALNGIRVTQVLRKGEPGGHAAYIGLAEVHDADDFWAALEPKLPCLEIEGFFGLNPLYAQWLTWTDTGNQAQYREAQERLGTTHLPKPRQDLYFYGNRVIKFFADTKQAQNRVARAQFLDGLVPEILDSGEYHYVYRRVDGEPFDAARACDFLDWCDRRLWRPARASRFVLARAFYYDKTRRRLDMMHASGFEDRAYVVNGLPCRSARELLETLSPSFYAAAEMVRWHGDLHPTNVLVTEDGYTLLDWRADYAGELEAGDLYYDLAKLYHGLLVGHSCVDDVRVDVTDGVAEISIPVPYRNLCAMRDIEAWANAQGLSAWRLKAVAALVALNSAPLHHHPYGEFLYLLGNRQLEELSAL